MTTRWGQCVSSASVDRCRDLAEQHLYCQQTLSLLLLSRPPLLSLFILSARFTV